MSEDWVPLVSLALALGVTICIETTVAVFFGLRRRALGAIAAVNLATNPLLNVVVAPVLGLGGVHALFHTGGSWAAPAPWAWTALAALELIVIVVEWRVLVWTLSSKIAGSRRLLSASAVMNATSAVLGTYLLTVLWPLF